MKWGAGWRRLPRRRDRWRRWSANLLPGRRELPVRSFELAGPLHRYLCASAPLSRVGAELRAKTLAAAGDLAGRQIPPEQGAFMALLVRLIGARRALDVGTFTGYSALVVAEALPADGQLVTCEISSEWTAIGQPFWERAGVAGKIDLRLAPAVETLDALLAQGEAGGFDFAFIDADKASYDAYYERCLELLRRGGVVAIDDAMSLGRVLDDSHQEQGVRAIRRLNAKVREDDRVDAAMLPIGDGLVLARKR